MSEVAELVAHIRRRREDDGYDLESVREIASDPTGVVELYGIIQKANVDRTAACDALEAQAQHIANLTGALLAEHDEVELKQAALEGISAKNDELAAKVAAMAQVVEAARAWAAARNGSGPYHLDCDRLEKALAKLEAANV